MAEIRILEVLTPAPDQNLVSLEEARRYLGTDPKDDARLKDLIADGSAAVASYTRRVWRQETVKETWYRAWFDLYYSPYNFAPKPLVLARYPVSEVSLVTEGDSDLTDTGWLVQGEAGCLYRQSSEGRLESIGWCGDTVAVTYTAGYTLEKVPDDVQRATLTMCRTLSSMRDPALRSIDIPGVQAETYWVGQVGENGALPPEVTGLLSPHIDMRS
jgi:hypothetical protein